MKISISRLLIMTLLVCIAMPISANAAERDPNGWWTSSTGNMVYIGANRQQVVITVQNKNGQRFQYNGWWTRIGEHFSYQTGSGVYNCSFVQNNSNTIVVYDQNGSPNTWTRAANSVPSPPTSPPPTTKQKGDGITGTWKSSTGTAIQIQTNGRNKPVFLSFITTNGKRMQGTGRWLSNYKFDYSIAGYQGLAECTVNKDNWNIIHCLYGGKWSTWTKMQ